jgi:AraC-like DNA-binding protein
MLDTGPLQIELLPRAAYSASDTVDGCVLGLALEPQRGVHAIDSDHRVDFQSRFGELSFKPAGMAVFSESPVGGEYLLVRARAPDASFVHDRPQWLADSRTLGWALKLRAALAGGTAAWDELSGLAQAFVCHAWSAAEHAQGARDSLRRSYEPVVLWIERALEEGRNADLRLEVLAGITEESVFQFLRGFSKAFGLTPHAYVAERRLQLARRLAADPSMSLAEVAAAAGYASQSHMGASSRRMIGETAAEWRLSAGRPRISRPR